MVLKSLVYLSDFGTLLLLKKDWNKSLKKKILKNLLLGDRVNLSSFRRRSIWEQVYEVNSLSLDYENFLEGYKKVSEGEEKGNFKQMEDLIRLDVLRSFQGHQELISQDEL